MLSDVNKTFATSASFFSAAINKGVLLNKY